LLRNVKKEQVLIPSDQKLAVCEVRSGKNKECMHRMRDAKRRKQCQLCL
jgi:3-deoxy-D-manno-octulosonic acid (KDO) 8-phosphate synthase